MSTGPATGAGWSVPAAVPPTLSGALTILFGAALALIGIRSSNSWLLLVGCAFLAPVLVSQLIRPGFGSISICFFGPDRVAVGEQVEQVFHVHNRGRLSTPVFRLTHMMDGFEPLSLTVPGLPPGEKATLSVGRTAIKRGVGHRHELSMRSTAPFGMVKHHHSLVARAQIRVHPALGPVADLSRVGIGDQAGGRPARSGDQLHGLREWRHGDAPGQVHWRATARQDRLIVIIPEITVQARYALVLAGWPTDDDWEALLSAAAWTAVDLAAHGSGSVRLSASGVASYLGNDPGAVLDWFAELHHVPPPEPGLLRAAARWADDDGLVLVASTRPLPQSAGSVGEGLLVLGSDGSVLES